MNTKIPMMIMRCDRKRGCNIGKVNKKKWADNWPWTDECHFAADIKLQLIESWQAVDEDSTMGMRANECF